MAIIEVQFKSAVFFDLVRRRINLMPPPVTSVPEVGSMPGGLVDRWECAGVALSTSSEAEGLDPLPSGAIRVSATIELHLTSYEAAKAAGSGEIPETTPQELIVVIRLLGGSGSGLAVEIEKVLLGDLDVSAFIGDVTFGAVSFGGLGAIAVAKTWIGSGSSVIAIRLATNSSDSVNMSVTNRIPSGLDWAQLVGAALLTDMVKDSVVESLSGDPKTPIEESATATWMPMVAPLGFSGWGVFAHAGILAIDACGPLKTDISVDLYFKVFFDFDASKTPPLRKVLSLSWDASDWDSFKCGAPIAGLVIVIGILTMSPVGVVLGAIAGIAILAAFAIGVEQGTAEQVAEDDPSDMQQIGGSEDDGFLLYEGGQAMPSPSADGLSLAVTGAEPGIDGLLIFGSAQVTQPTPSPQFYAGDPWWSSGYSCKKHMWEKELELPRIWISDPPRAVIVHEVIAEPQAEWTTTISPTGSIDFQTTDPTPDPGTPLEAWVHSSAGVRWFQFSPIPPPPPAPSQAELIDYEVMCKANSMIDKPNDWPFNFFNPRWLGDPPQDLIGSPDLVREWMVQISSLPAFSTVQAFIVSEGTFDPGRSDLSRSRPDAEFKADGTGIANIRLTTRADEQVVFQMEKTRGIEASTRVACRWLTPLTRIGVGESVEAVARVPVGVVLASAGDLRVVESSGRIGQPVAFSTIERLASRGGSAWGMDSRKLEQLLLSLKSDGVASRAMRVADANRQVYVVHDGELVVCQPGGTLSGA